MTIFVVYTCLVMFKNYVIRIEEIHPPTKLLFTLKNKKFDLIHSLQRNFKTKIKLATFDFRTAMKIKHKNKNNAPPLFLNCQIF